MVNVRYKLLSIILTLFLESDLERHLGVRGLFCTWCPCWDCQLGSQQLWTAWYLLLSPTKTPELHTSFSKDFINNASCLVSNQEVIPKNGNITGSTK